jgi:YVTN family beta-propeller protein
MKEKDMRITLTALAATALAASAAAETPARVYVPLGEAGAVAAIDPETDRVTGRIEGLPAVHGLAVTPDGETLVAGSFATRPAGAAPERPTEMSEAEHAAHHGGGGLMAGAAPADGEVSVVTLVRAEDGRVLRRIDAPGAVHHVAVGPRGRVAVVTHPGEGAVTILDLERGEALRTVATGPSPNYAAFSPDGDVVYVSNTGNDTVSAVDARDGLVRWNARTGAGPEHLVLSKDGGRLYVADAAGGSVTVIDTAAREAADTIEIGDALHGIDLSDDERTLYVAGLGQETVVAVDLETGERRSAALAAPYHLEVVDGLGDVYVTEADGPALRVLGPDLALKDEIALDGRGHQIVVAPGS